MILMFQYSCAKLAFATTPTNKQVTHYPADKQMTNQRTDISRLFSVDAGGRGMLFHPFEDVVGRTREFTGLAEIIKA